jgi:hypothetical protein
VLTALLEGLGPETRDCLLKAVFDGNGVGRLGSLETVAVARSVDGAARALSEGARET